MAEGYLKVLCPHCNIGKLIKQEKGIVKCTDLMCGSAFPGKRFSKPGEAKKIDKDEAPKG